MPQVAGPCGWWRDREYPKYGMISRYFVYKQAIMEEAGRLVQASVLGEKDDIFYLRYQEASALD